MSGNHHYQRQCDGVVVVDDSSSAIGATTITSTCRGCSPSPATTAASIDGGNKILQKRWVCDVCKVKWFLDFQEACAHERICNGHENNGVGPSPPSSSLLMPRCDIIDIVEETTPSMFTDSNDGTEITKKRNPDGQRFASFFRPQRGKTSTSKDQPKMAKKKGSPSISSSPPLPLLSSHTKEKKEELSSEMIPGVTQAEYDEHLAAEKEYQRRSTRITTRLAAIDEKTTLNAPDLKSTSSKRARLGRRERTDGRDPGFEFDVDDESTDDAAENECVVIDEGKSTSKKSSVITKKKGLLSKRLMAEHHAVEFFAKRKKAAADERERQKKRAELRLLNSKDNKIELRTMMTAGFCGDDEVKVASRSKDGSADIKEGVKKRKQASRDEEFMHTAPSIDSSYSGTYEQINLESKMKCYPLAVRFPCPSHLAPYDESMEIDVEENSTSLRRLRETLRYQDLKPVTSSRIVTTDDVTQHSHDIVKSAGDEMMVRDETFTLLSSVFDLSAKKEEQQNQFDDDATQLWVDKYAITNIPDDVLGTLNKEASKKLLSFVEEWKVRRHKSVQDMGRVKSKGKRRGKKKKSHGYDSDDSFLDDEEGLENIFLITGPTGSGKSRIVHAVAEQSECVVIEINSSEQRSGAALKRAIQETTQSHSNLAMSRKRQGLGKGYNDFFGNNADAGTATDELDEDSDRWYESSDEESVKESHSLTIIMIDEVDLLFDEDTAFWPALAQVSQKAKCPIVLTATSLPAEMKNFRYQYISVERPPSQECSIKMTEVAKAEGMHFYRGTVEDISKRLEVIAEICRCDMRRIVNAMQLFRHTQSRQHSSKGLDDTNIFDSLPLMHCPTSSKEIADRPLILSVEPRLVHKHKHTAITISGKSFASTSTNLFIGGRVCNHFRIIGDNKIIAVCPPCVVPDGVSEEAIYEDELARNIDCLTCKFVNVVVSKKCANGLIIQSNSALAGTSSTYSNSWTLEYDIPIRDDIWDTKTSREDFIRKLKAQKRNQANMASEENDENMSRGDDYELMSSDEEDLEDNSNLPEISSARQNIGVEKKSTERTISVEDIDPQNLLDKATADMDATGEISIAEPMISSEARQSYFEEINNHAEALRRVSDAILLEDAFMDLAIPSLAGPVEGFGFDTPEALSCKSSHADPLIDKLSKDKKTKPPSSETLFSTGVNESGFFFGNGDAYVTYPNRKRDRQLLCYSELHSRGLGYLDSNACLVEENGENSRSWLGDDEDMLCSSFLQLRTRAQFEDDSLLRLTATQPYLSTSSILVETRNHGLNVASMPLMQFRRNEVAINALRVMHSVVANCDLWYTGLRHDSEDCVDHVWRRDSMLDHTLALDYLPYLRAIAHHEVRVQRKFEDVMRGTKAGAVSRRRRSYVRRNYLDECAGGQDSTIEDGSLHLARTYMIKEDI